MPNSWLILTGEYPPTTGGVADYARLIGRGLLARGDQVGVVAGPLAGELNEPSEPTGQQFGVTGEGPRGDGVRVHRLCDRFGPRGLRALSRMVDEAPAGTRLLVQYVPHNFGYKAMNLLLPAWLLARRGRNPIDVIFHEVATPWLGWSRPRHATLAGVTRAMAYAACRSAERVFVTIPAWGEMLRPALRRGQEPVWLPIPSMVATEADECAVRSVRERFARDDETILIGHFGTFGKLITDLLTPAATALLSADPRRRLLLMGRRSDAFAAEWTAREPTLAGRVRGVGMIDARDVAAHLKACDLLLQPYADGVSCRRGTTMAGLALGCAMVSNLGHLSEDFWAESGAVALADLPDPTAIAAVAEATLGDAAKRRALGEQARALYARSFDLQRTLEKLTGL